MKKISVNGVSFNVPDFSNSHQKDVWKEISNGLWEPQTFEIIKTFVGREDFVFEVGIDGAQTTLFTAQVSSGVIALDPIPESILYLKSCIKVNSGFKEKVLAVHGALSNSRGKTLFTKGSPLFDDVHFSVSDPKVLVETYMIDDIEKIFRKNISFINMDIEGGEYICLPSMRDWLLKRKPKLLLSLHPGFLLKRTHKLKALNYIYRIRKQQKIFNVLKVYPYIYDVSKFKKMSPFSLFRLKFLRGKEGRDLQILCSFKKLST
jgi:FkbM family methyltransferase